LMPEQKAPSSGAFLPASLMYFCSGQPMHFCSGVDSHLAAGFCERVRCCGTWVGGREIRRLS
jgi:hypothetical protein